MARQDDYIRTALRLPPDMHKALHDSADASGKSFNAEIIARLQASFEEPAQGESFTTSTADAVHLLLKKVEAIEARLIQPEGTSLFKAGTPRVR